MKQGKPSRKKGRKGRRRGCEGKRFYETEDRAKGAVRSILAASRKNPDRIRNGFLKPYKCPHCGKWHVGRSKGGHSMPMFIDQLKAAGRF